METTASLLKSVVVAVAQYNNHKIERNLVFLQRQIDALISKTSRGCSLKFFNPSEILAAECLTCLVNLVSDCNTKPSLLLKCILLFNNLVSDSYIRECLHDKFDLTPALASVIKYNSSSSSDTLTAEALHLLMKVTYGHRISFQEPYMEDLIRFLLSHICSPATGMTQPAMGTLVNLTRDNFSVQSYIKNNENMQDISRQLTKLLGDENQTVILFSLTLLVNLCLQEKMGGKFYNETNAPKTFQMVFNILIDGDSGETRRYAVDLFRDILKVGRLQTCLANYEFLGTCLDQTLNLLSTCSPDSVVKIFEFLQTLCHIEGVRVAVCRSLFATFPIQDQSCFPTLAQTPLSRIADPLLATIHWAGQSPDTHGLAPLAAYELLIEIYEELVFSHDKIHHEKHAAAILPTILHTLKTPLEGDNSAIRRKIELMVKAVKLLLTFCNNDTLLTIISKKIDFNLMAHILHYQFENNSVAMKTKLPLATDDWSTSGVDLVLNVLDLVARLKNQKVEDLFIATMQETRVVPFLASGLCSPLRQRVQDTLALVCLSSRLEGFPSIILGDALAYSNAEKESRLQAVTHQGPVMMQQPLTSSPDNKENLAPGFALRELSRFQDSNCGETTSGQDISSECIQNLIDKMDSGLDLKDAKSSEIHSVYSRSLQAVQTKVQHLQDLLEAKTLALTQADRMLAQYRARKGQDEAEANHVRSMLVNSEKKCEMMKSEVSDLRESLERLRKDRDELVTENQKLQQVASMHQQLTAAHNDLSERYESTTKSYQTMKQEHKSLTEMHEMLQKHNVNLKQQYDTAMEQLTTLQEERRKLSTQLKTSETKLADTTKASLKWEYDYKRSEEERETMEMSIEKLRGDMAKTEAKKKQLQDQVSQLEFACNQHEAKISQYEEKNRELQTEIDKHRQIAALINSLSSGKASESIPDKL